MTTIDMTNPAIHNRSMVVQLRGQLRIIAAGMTIRGLSKTAALHRATWITGKRYPRGPASIHDAIAHLSDLLPQADNGQ